MRYKSGCIVCGEEIKYLDDYQNVNCEFCEMEFDSNAICVNGHYICDDCHSDDANRFITKMCLSNGFTDPMALALKIFKHPSINLHGPEHHYIVPATLLTAYANKTGNKNKLKKWLEMARYRSVNVLGGFCGFYGACGAGIGTGIFVSTITAATPLSTNSWKQANLLTSKSLCEIGNSGGPRCCKRDSFLAIKEATIFIEKEFDIKLDIPEKIVCEFSKLNKECQGANCQFYILSN
jgi:Family of unknown function (DUF5714)